MTLQIFLLCISPSDPARTGKILGKGEHRAAVDLPEPGDHPVRRDLHLLHAEIDAPVRHKNIGLPKGPRVKEQIQTLPGGELAAGPLLLHRLGPTHPLDLPFLLLQLPDLLGHGLHRQLLFIVTPRPRITPPGPAHLPGQISGTILLDYFNGLGEIICFCGACQPDFVKLLTFIG